MAFPRSLVVQTQGSGEVDVGDVQTEYRERSYFVGRSGLLPYGSASRARRSRTCDSLTCLLSSDHSIIGNWPRILRLCRRIC